MKRILLFVITMTIAGSLLAQNLVTGNSDFVGFSSSARSAHIVEADPDNFFWISGSTQTTSVDHPMLSDVSSNFANIFFLRCNDRGDAISSNHIKGTYGWRGAYSFNEGLTVFGLAWDTVDASGSIVPLDGADYIEFLAKYNSNCELEKIVNVWKLNPSQYPYSSAEMDKKDGSIYIYGYGFDPMVLDGYGFIGEEWIGDYIYVIKYDADLQLKWVYTAGFKSADLSGYFSNLMAFPDCSGNVVFTGAYNAEQGPVFGSDELPFYQDGNGLFAVKLNRDMEQVWVQDGSMQGLGNGTYLFKGLAMVNGDLVMAGVTTTGYFKLGNVEFTFENGSGNANHFAYRLKPDGSVDWFTSFHSMGITEGEGKKGAKAPEGVDETKSELFWDYFYEDAIQWNEQILYMAGTFLNNSFEVAGVPLAKKHPQGIFVASVDLNSGEQLWGYGLSSNWVCLNGFDMDASGNVSLMGCTSEVQNYDLIGDITVPGTDLVFHLGLDYHGQPLWYNNAYLQKLGHGIYGIDLEVLRDGEVFSSIYLSEAGYLEIGGSSLLADYNYLNWLVALGTVSELGGSVTDQSGNPVYPGYVRAYKSSRSGAYPLVNSTMLDEAGTFQFTGIYPGNYTLKVAPDLKNYPDAIPTYRGDQVEWNSAEFNDVSVDTKDNSLDIMVMEVPKLTPADGSGNISGNVSYEEDGILKGTLARPVTKGPVILKRRTKKSTTADEVLAYVETDEFGNYIFDNVPDGNYLLIVDIPGLEMVEIHEITIQGDQVIYGLDYTVGYNEIYTYTGVGIQPEETTDLKIFPNPGNGLIFMEFLKSGDYQVSIFGVDGRMISSREFPAATGYRTMDISELNEGIYMIRIEGPDLSTTCKYVKR